MEEKSEKKSIVENDVAVVNNSNDDKGQHRIRVAKTMLINLSFIVSLGLGESSRGPALLDLAEVYDVSLDKISIMIVVSSAGSILGCFFVGYLMDRFPKRHDLILFIITFCGGSCICFYPYCVHLYPFFVLQFFSGCFSAGLDAGGNVMVLDIFRGLNGGPYMHSIHFSFSLGAFLAPLAVSPFLSTEKSVIKALEANGTKEEEIEDIIDSLGSDLETKIGYYYPAVGILAILVSFGFLYFALRPPKLQNPTKNGDSSSQKNENNAKKMSFNLKMLVLLLIIFFFAYVGIEYVYAIYLTAFAVECKLSLTKLQGARLAAIYWANFALMRFLAIFAAVALNPAIIMLISFVLCLVGGLALVIYAEESLLLLQICTGVMGLGMASVYATGLLWLEGFTPVTSAMAAMFTFAASLGPDLFPLLVGQFMESMPMFMMYLSFGVIVMCVLLFGGAYYFGLKVRKERLEQESKVESEQENQKEDETEDDKML